MALCPALEVLWLLLPRVDSIALRQVSLVALHLRDCSMPLQPQHVARGLMGLQPQDLNDAQSPRRDAVLMTMQCKTH